MYKYRPENGRAKVRIVKDDGWWVGYLDYKGVHIEQIAYGDTQTEARKSAIGWMRDNPDLDGVELHRKFRESNAIDTAYRF